MKYKKITFFTSFFSICLVLKRAHGRVMGGQPQSKCNKNVYVEVVDIDANELFLVELN